MPVPAVAGIVSVAVRLRAVAPDVAVPAPSEQGDGLGRGVATLPKRGARAGEPCTEQGFASGGSSAVTLRPSGAGTSSSRAVSEESRNGGLRIGGPGTGTP